MKDGESVKITLILAICQDMVQVLRLFKTGLKVTHATNLKL